MKLIAIYENEEYASRESMILEIGEEKDRIIELSNPQKANRKEIEEED
jgi:hypothetical protein